MTKRQEWFAKFGLEPRNARRLTAALCALMDHGRAIERAGANGASVEAVIVALKHIVDDAPESQK